MQTEFARLVIVGGGTAGWLAAAYIAARHRELSITLVEAPDIPTIGVGEGSWPTLRATLQTIGVDEADFIAECEASFKQGTRFDGWTTGQPGDRYYHPFTPPPPDAIAAVIAAMHGEPDKRDFAHLASAQAAICDADLAPRQRVMPPYAGALNYGYHLDAGKFAGLLRRRATDRLGVTHLSDVVTGVDRDGDRIISVQLRDGGNLPGDLFIDCTGMAARLIDQELGAEWIDRSDVSFNDRALAVQIPTMPGSPIASQTVSTAHRAGWIWDIALPTRRGIGCVYSSRHMADDAARETLAEYVTANLADAPEIAPRLLQFRTGHRAQFWRGNCIAIGLSAGFIEPLEASAIVLIELSVQALADHYPRSHDALPQHAARFNRLFRYRWDRIVDFLKLHYVLSQRSEPYWQDQRDPATIPQSLADQLILWRDHAPSAADFPMVDEMFSAASQQYVLYGMGYPPPRDMPAQMGADALAKLSAIADRTRALAAALPTNRAYADASASQFQSQQKDSALQ